MPAILFEGQDVIGLLFDRLLRNLRRCVVLARRSVVLAAALAILALSPNGAKAQTASPSAAMIANVNRVLESQRTGVPFRWSVPEVGLKGTITVNRTYYRRDRTPCREYTRTVEGERSTQTIRGTGCRITSGVWTLTETPTAAEPPTATASRPPSAPRPDAAAKPRVAAPPFMPAAPARKPELIAGVLPTPSVE